MDDRRAVMLPMSIGIENGLEGKYPVMGPAHVCAGVQLAIASAVIGGIFCSISFIAGEWLLEYNHKHKDYAHGYSIFYDMSKMGMLGGVLVNLVLYIIILMYACCLDPKRNKPSKNNMIVSGYELVFCPETPVGLSCFESLCCPILMLTALHALNMLLSGSAGYWIYTRHYKSTIDFQGSIEALAVGMAVTMIPFCFSNVFLFTAYSNFKISDLVGSSNSFPRYGNSPLLAFNRRTREEELEDALSAQRRENARLRRTGIF